MTERGTAGSSRVEAGTELAYAEMTGSFTIPNNNTWTDVPNVSIVVPARKLHTLVMSGHLTALQGTVAAGVNVNPQVRLVDGAGNALLWFNPIFQFPTAANGQKGLSWYLERRRDLSAAPVTVKMQALLNAAGLGQTQVFGGYGNTPIFVRAIAR